MRFRGEKQRVVCDPYFGPIHYEMLETVYFEFEDIPSVTKKFIQWIERNMKQYGY